MKQVKKKVSVNFYCPHRSVYQCLCLLLITFFFFLRPQNKSLIATKGILNITIIFELTAEKKSTKPS